MINLPRARVTCRWVEDHLVAYLHEALKDAERKAIENHLTACPQCMERYQTFQSVHARLAFERPIPVPPLTSRQKRNIHEQVHRKRKIGDLMDHTQRFAISAFGLAVVAVIIVSAALLATRLVPWQMSGKTPAGDVPSVEPDGSAPGNNITITFAAPKGLEAQFIALAETFHQEHPEITVQIRSADEIISDPADPTGGLVSGADSGYYYVDPQAAAKGQLYDLTDLMAADPTFQPDDFFPQVLQAYRWNEKTWALPSQAELFFLVYDKTRLEEAGAAVPGLTWTQAEFADSAARMTRSPGEEGAVYGYIDKFGQGQMGFFDTSLREALRQGQLDIPEFENDLQWYKSLATKAMPELLDGTEGLDRDHKLVDNHQAAMWSDSLTNYLYYSKDRSLGLTGFPSGGQTVVRGLMSGYFISAGTTHPQETWLWVSFLTRQYLGQLSGNDHTPLPARRSTAEAIQYWAQFDAQALPAVQYAAEHLAFDPFDPVGPRTLLSTAVAKARKEGSTVRDALKHAQDAYAKKAAELALQPPVAVQVAPPEPTPRPDETVVQFYGLGLDEYVLPDVLQSFQKEYPHIQVQIIEQGQENLADCGTNTFPNTRSLDSLIETDPSFTLDAYYPSMLAPFQREGQLWALPLQGQARVLRYNRKLFDEAGIPYPTPEWTLDDFLYTAKALTRQTEKGMQYGYVAYLGENRDVLSFIAAQQVQLLDDQGTLTFQSEASAYALRWYTDLAMVHGVTPRFDDIKQGTMDGPGIDARMKLVTDGQAAMWTEYLGYFDAGLIPPEQAGTVTLPRGEIRATDFFIDGLVIAQESDQVGACWNLIKYLTQQPSLISGLPTRKDVFASTEHQSGVSAEQLQVEQILLEKTHPTNRWNVDETYAIMALERALGEVYSGTSVEEALAHAQQWWQENKDKPLPGFVPPP